MDEQNRQDAQNLQSEQNQREKVPLEIIGICATNAVLHTEGVAELVPAPGVSFGKDKDGIKGIKISESKKGLELDIYLNVRFGAKIPDTAWNIQENVKHRLEDLTESKVSQVNIHIMGVSPKDAKGKEQTK